MRPSFCLLILLTLYFAFPVDTLMAQRRGRRNQPTAPRIAPEDLEFEMGVARIPDRETFEKLSYQGPEVFRDSYLADLEFVKFIIENVESDSPSVYFMNTENYRAHPPYMNMIGISSRCRGAITYLPRITSPDGSAGLYIVDYQPNDSFPFETIQKVQGLLTAKMPLLKGKVAFHPLQGNLKRYEEEKKKYEAGGVAVHLDSDLYANISYLPLNPTESFGRLRVMDNETRPSPRDIVICKTLPNQMPRVAGVISEVRQTPLSHVNLRAIQDKVPNAYINNAMVDPNIKQLIGKQVYYQVTAQGYKIREATNDEVEQHFAALRPSEPQSPNRDLSVTTSKALADINFQDADVFGSKAANLATMHSFRFPDGMIPDGHALPFHFYDEFMKHNGLYEHVDKMMDDSFLSDRDVRKKQLSKLRKKIEKSEMPDWMMDALQKVHDSFPEGTSIRCRSSTNNEDLPGFSGAGLYDSFTHKPDEGHLAESIKQVFASLWNLRAVEERQFFRIDHRTTAMGVLLHPNYTGEQANGVAVTEDILYETHGNYYLNTQIGEDLVTNPDAESSPEETLLAWWEDDGHVIVRRSNSVGPDQQLLTDEQLNELRKRLGKVHQEFARLHKKTEDEPFAMEIEYKITKEGKLVIKQARPWVY